ncbi:MAG: hypothetical protein P8Z30_09665, partial [Acidobacteriota bacterium]
MAFWGGRSIARLAVFIGAAIASVAMLRLIPAAPVPAESGAPQYTPDGRLLLPRGYRQWIYLSSGLGMEYSPTGKPGSEFTNVFVKPSAWRQFVQTGRWP